MVTTYLITVPHQTPAKLYELDTPLTEADRIDWNIDDLSSHIEADGILDLVESAARRRHGHQGSRIVGLVQDLIREQWDAIDLRELRRMSIAAIEVFGEFIAEVLEEEAQVIRESIS